MKKVIFSMLFAGLFTTSFSQNYSSMASTPGTLTVTATTSATSTPDYGTRNDDAFWIQTSAGAFVKTIIGCTSSDKNDLFTWKAATSSYNVVDAITAATRSTYGVRTGTWKGTNVSGAVVADGVYTVKMEMTDFSGQGSVGTFTFTKGPTAQTLTPANVTSFSNISIKWVPSVSTALEDIQMSNLFQVYPNPAASSIFVNGLNIQEIEIFNMAGTSVLKTTLHNVNLNTLPKGVYMIKINSETGTVMKKLIKK